MKVYLVGGAVRDRLLGLPVAERDWVVVGSSPEELERLGYVSVGREFPVFLHPETREEHALARLERKVAPGYRGFTTEFSPDVTLEDDLRRRDLTINAMAEDEGGALVDPYGGRRDLDARVLRHVSDAFVEDPVRLLRVARLAARFVDGRLVPNLELGRAWAQQPDDIYIASPTIGVLRLSRDDAESRDSSGERQTKHCIPLYEYESGGTLAIFFMSAR